MTTDARVRFGIAWLRLAAAGGVFLGLAAFWALFARQSCAALISPVAAFVMLTLALREAALFRRRALVDRAFREDSWIGRRARGSVLITLATACLAAVMAVAAALELVSRPPSILAALALGLLIAALLFGRMKRALARTLRPEALALVSASWTSRLVFLLFLAALSSWTWLSPPPAWLDADLSAAYAEAAAAYRSSCAVTDTVLSAAILPDVAAWWLMTNATLLFSGAMSDALWALAWAVFVAADSLAAAALSRLVVAVCRQSDGAGDV